MHLRHASTLSVLAGKCVQRHDRGRPDCDFCRLLTWCALFLHSAHWNCRAFGFFLFLQRRNHRVEVPRGCSPALEPTVRPGHSSICSSDVTLRIHVFAPTPVHVCPHPSYTHKHHTDGLLVHLHRHYNPSTSNQTNWSPCAFTGMHPQPRLALCAFADPLAQSHWSPCAFTGTHLQTHRAPCAFTWMHHQSKHQHKCILKLVHNPEWVPSSSIHSHQVEENLFTRTCVSPHRNSTKMRRSACPQLAPPPLCWRLHHVQAMPVVWCTESSCTLLAAPPCALVDIQEPMSRLSW